MTYQNRWMSSSTDYGHQIFKGQGLGFLAAGYQVMLPLGYSIIWQIKKRFSSSGSCLI